MVSLKKDKQIIDINASKLAAGGYLALFELSAKRTFANSRERFELTSYLTGLICYILDAPLSDLGPFQHNI